MSDYLDPGNEELLQDFYAEAELQIETLEANILVLEKDPKNPDAVDEIFRAAHTLKGGAATVQMTELAEFTHLVEDALDEIRSGSVSVGESVVDVLLNSIDIVKQMLEMRKEGEVFQEDVSPITEALQRILSGKGLDATPSSPSDDGSQEPIPVTAESGGDLSEYDRLELREAAGENKSVYRVTVEFREDNPMNSVGGIQVFALLKQHGQILRTIPDFDTLYEDTFHPVAEYFVASEEESDVFDSLLQPSDVIGNATITEIGSADAADAVGAAKDTASPAEPAHTTKPEESTKPERAEAQEEEEPIDRDESAQTADRIQKDHKRSTPASSILRVDSRRIDDLLNLVSETVINKAGFNQISNAFGDVLNNFGDADMQFRERMKQLFDALPEYLDEMQRGGSTKDIRNRIYESFGDLPSLYADVFSSLKGTVTRFRGASQNLGRIASELQEGVMRIRMVPISQIFSRFPRLVRDLSRTLDKKVNLTIEGEDTELDKSVIEDLLDPLIHCVRNSIDHGIEDAATRREKGKPDDGTVTLRASNEGNMILIEVADDGKGIDVDSVRSKAVDRGLIHPSKQLSDMEAFNLIFDPGFSTAQKITNVSGRGVGLDVVKRQIEKLNGTVTVWSRKGEGTRFTIKIPLTLAIIQGLLVRVGPELYAIPITSVIESHRIRPDEIKMIDNYEVFNVRDDVVSLIRLNRLFRIDTNESPEYHYVVIVGTSERKMGLIVDSLVGEEDVVIKPLRDHFTSSPGIAGANITGEGRVSLIIDVSQLLDLGLRREKEAREQREMTIQSRR